MFVVGKVRFAQLFFFVGQILDLLTQRDLLFGIQTCVAIAAEMISCIVQLAIHTRVATAYDGIDAAIVTPYTIRPVHRLLCVG